MDIESLKKEIEKVQDQIFMNNMADHWSKEDYAFDAEKRAYLRELMKKLEEANETT